MSDTRTLRISWIIVVIMIMTMACMSGCSQTNMAAETPQGASTAETQASQEASATAEETSRSASAHESVYADIEVKDYGMITVELDPSAAPATVENFIELANSGFYDGLTFHRIMEGFMMQGGAPTGTGMGGLEKAIVGEFESNGYENPISHVRGTISMARSNDPDSATSQFFIVQDDSTFLDGSYAGFGTVTAGMDVVDAICEAAQPIDDNGTIKADEQPVITSITIRES